jgi:hypothetical protein
MAAYEQSHLHLAQCEAFGSFGWAVVSYFSRSGRRGLVWTWFGFLDSFI